MIRVQDLLAVARTMGARRDLPQTHREAYFFGITDMLTIMMSCAKSGASIQAAEIVGSLPKVSGADAQLEILNALGRELGPDCAGLIEKMTGAAARGGAASVRIPATLEDGNAQVLRAVAKLTGSEISH